MAGCGACCVLAFSACSKVRWVADEDVSNIRVVWWDLRHLWTVSKFLLDRQAMEGTNIGMVDFNIGHVVECEVFAGEVGSMWVDVHGDDAFGFVVIVYYKGENTGAAACVYYNVCCFTFHKVSKGYCIGSESVSISGLADSYAGSGEEVEVIGHAKKLFPFTLSIKSNAAFISSGVFI